MNEILDLLRAMINSAGFFLIIALLVSMVLVQGIKSVMKDIIPKRFRKWRVKLTFVIAYFIGFQVGMYFLDGPDQKKWSVAVGAINPILYFGLLQWFVVRGNLLGQSIMKMRPIKKDEDGILSLDDTQSFMAKAIHKK